MKNLLLTLSIFLFTLSAQANDLKIEPVYSFETTRREYPAPAKQITKTYIGLSAVYGTKLLAGEFEVAQSTYTDDLPSDNDKVTSLTKRAMIGIRSYPLTSQYFGFFLRAGVRAKQETLDIKEDGESRTEELPVYIDPYAGAGATLAFANNFALNASATMVQNNSVDADSDEKYDVQYTLSASMRFGNR